MPAAYLVQDHFEVTGTVKGRNESYDGAWNFFVGDSDFGTLIYFAADADVNGLEAEYTSAGNPVTVSAVVVQNNSGLTAGFVYQDAEIIAMEEPEKSVPDERLLTFTYEDREFFKEYVQGLEPMAEEAVRTALTDVTFSMRNNYGGDGDGTHTITFFGDGTLDATYEYEGARYSMFESWRIEDGKVVLTHTATMNTGETRTTDTRLTPYQYDETRYLLIDEVGDYSMVLTAQA